MSRTLSATLLLAVFSALPAFAQPDASSLESYFAGRQVMLKVDMPGSQKGVDLKYNKPVPMDWNDYSSRLKSYGVALHKGDTARVTKFTVKNDMMEFQLNGGGYGTAGDDTETTVSAVAVPKSQYEKDLEKQIAATTDANRKRDLQHDLDRERGRRERQDAANQNDALIASQMKAQQVAQRRLTGGSRFNLRWQGTIPSDSRNPDTVMKLLAEYVDFNPSARAPAPSPASYNPSPQASETVGVNAGSPISQLRRGMKIGEVNSLYGQGKVISESVSEYGLKTQVLEYASGENLVDVTSVEGVVVRYSISSK